ncbi:MAG TPA: NHL repeat-containing protein, partial [Candidatus Cybelea sp.]|nr:NHL repeat-containing protein [Candidatus Cybelea sp.]
MALLRPLRASVAFALLAGAGCSAAATPALAPSQPLVEKSVRTLGRPVPHGGHNYVYVADAFADTVWIFPAGGLNPNPVGEITQGIKGPQGIAVDATGNLYVSNSSAAPPSVTIYPPGSTSPSLTLTQGLTVPAAVAVDSKGNVWVSNEMGSFQGSVVEFPAGKTSPSTIIGGLNPYGVAVDSQDNLYVENYNTSAAFVSVYPPGATKPSKEFGASDLIEPLGIAVGPTGDVYVCDFQYNNVYIYRAKSHKLLKTVTVEAGSLA